MQGIEDFNEKKPYLLMENVEKLNGERLNFYMVGVCIPVAGAVFVCACMYVPVMNIYLLLQ